MSKYVCKNCSCDLPYGPYVTPERIEDLERLATQRGARMKLMRLMLIRKQLWSEFVVLAKAEDWFDEDGVPVEEVE